MATKKTQTKQKSVPAQEQVTEAQPAQEQVTEAQPAQLTIADLQSLGQIIDLASKRGAFQAGELSFVGASFDKLTAFLAYVEKTQTPQPAEQEPSTTAGE